ncbi:MAG: hypothetical protein IKJ87_01365 [Ruminococcus sp.]|nr:hypothetical protein [Ruminococcus sp.]
MNLEEALKNYIDRSCTITTRDDEYDGLLVEVGSGYVKINDGISDCLINLKYIESVSFDE